jgi:hypothetical protein
MAMAVPYQFSAHIGSPPSILLKWIMACDYRPKHRIYMSFFLRSGWYVSFLESDLKTPLARTFNFADPEKIRDLARRGDALGTLEARQMMEQAIETGRGGLYLNLTEDQYRKLRP